MKKDIIKSSVMSLFALLLLSAVFAACGGGGGGGDTSTTPTPTTYTVTYNGNGNTGGSVPSDSNSYQQGNTVTVLGNTGSLVKTGYTFAGWNTQANGSGTAHTAGQTFSMGAANVTCYAKWTANTVAGYAYAVNHNGGGAGSISQYTIGPNGALTPMSTPTVPSGGNDPRYISVDPLGKYVYVSNITSNTVAQFTIGADGSLAPMSTPTILMGPVGAGQLYYPLGMGVHPLGKYAYVALQENSSVNQYAIGADGTLSALTPSTVISGDPNNGHNGPTAVAIDPSGNYAYVANGGSATVSQYTINQTTGALSAMTPSTVATGGNAFEIKIASTPSGKYAYVANYSEGTVSQYSINPSNGMLSSLGTVTAAQGQYALSIAVDPTGKFAYVPICCASPSAVIAQFKINQTTGVLSSNGTVSAGGAAAAWIAIDASGKYAYATSGESGWGNTSIAQYTIDQTTGALTLMSNPTVQAGFGPSEIVTVGK